MKRSLATLDKQLREAEQGQNQLINEEILKRGGVVQPPSKRGYLAPDAPAGKAAKRWKDLGKRELAHLKDSGCTTLAEFKRTAAHQKEQRDAAPYFASEPCWQCRTIAEKLGLPT